MAAGGTGPLKRIDLLKQRDLVRGAVDVGEHEGGVRFMRMTDSMYEYFGTSGGLTCRARCTTGVRIAFRSDTQIVRLALRYGEPIWCKRYWLDLTVDGEVYGVIGPRDAPEGTEWEDTIFTAQVRGEREFVIWLPHLTEVMIQALEIDEDAAVEALQRRKKWLLIGDSISQGFVSTSPRGTYAALAAEAVNMNHCNVAVGGSVSNPVLADAATAFDPDLITVAHGANERMYNVPGADFAAEVRRLARRLREVRPETRIVWITPIHEHTSTERRNEVGLLLEEYGDIIRREVAGIPDIETIDGYSLVPDERQWFFNYADSHPGDAGHRLYARNLAPALLGERG